MGVIQLFELSGEAMLRLRRRGRKQDIQLVAQILGGQPGMTGYLHVNYHNRTPVNTQLKLEASLVKVEGRKTIIRGEMFADGIMTASCEGLFVQPRGGMMSIKTLDVPKR